MASHQQLGKGRESVLVEFAWAGGFPSEGRTLPCTKCVGGGGYIQQSNSFGCVHHAALLPGSARVHFMHEWMVRDHTQQITTKMGAEMQEMRDGNCADGNANPSTIGGVIGGVEVEYTHHGVWV